MRGLFSRTKLLESKIEEYLQHTSEAGLLFREAIRNYLEGKIEEFERRRRQVDELENRADGLRRAIERQLYVETLIPESRGDVLGILEQTDEVINCTKTALMQFSVELPDIPDEFRPDYLELADFGTRSVQDLVLGIRAFFTSVQTVPDCVHKVSFWEKEADKVAERLKRRIFETELDLSRKIHLSDFVAYIDSLADQAEDVSERLSISTIKRSV